MDAGLGAGLVTGLAHIGNRVFDDRNANGLQDAGELGTGLRARLQNQGNDDALGSDINGIGRIDFFNLAAGTLVEHLDAGAYRVLDAAPLPSAASLLSNDNGLDALLAQGSSAAGPHHQPCGHWARSQCVRHRVERAVRHRPFECDCAGPSCSRRSSRSTWRNARTAVAS